MARGVRRGGRKLAESGARIVTVDMEPFLAAAKLLYDGALVSERYAAVGEFIDAHPDASFDPTVRRIISAARDIPAHQLVRDRREVDRLRAVAMAALEGVDALMVPTAPMHPRIDEVAADPVGVNSRMGIYTNFCNLFDLCGVAVPAGTAGAGAVRDDRAGPRLRGCGRTRHRRAGNGKTQRPSMFGRWPRRTRSSWWCSARTFAAVRCRISSPIRAPGGSARSRPRRATGCRCCRRSRPSRPSPGCPTARRAPR